MSLAELATKTETHQGTLLRFLRAMATIDILEILDNGDYQAGPMLAFVHDIMAPCFDETAYQSWDKAMLTLKTGEAAWDQVFGSPFYHYLDDNPEQSAAFDRWNANSAKWLDPMIKLYDFGQFEHLMDIGGGHGGFLSNVLNHYRQLQGTVFDRQSVLSHSEKALQDLPVAKRIKTHGGNFFEQVPDTADGYCLSRVLLNWNDDQVIEILSNCRKAMSTNDKLLILDFYIPEADDPVYPYMVFNDLNLLVNTGGGSRSIECWHQLIESAGFNINQFLTEPPSPLFLIEAQPA